MASFLGFDALLSLQADGFPALPDHEKRDAEIDHDGNDADHEVDVAFSFQELNQLRADFGAADGAEGHDQAEPQVNIAQGPMPFGGHDRLADDVGEIGPDREIPMHPDCA